MRRWLALGMLAAMGCVKFNEPEAAPPPRPVAMASEPYNPTQEERMKHQDDANERQAKWIADREKKHQDDRAAACEPDRAARVAHMEGSLAARAARAAAKAWEGEHCGYIDRGKPVIKTYEDSSGNITQRRVMDRHADYECDAKKPAELVNPPASPIPFQEELKDTECKEFDVPLSEAAVRYWDPANRISRNRQFEINAGGKP